jgi:hypothetical protein
VTASRFERWTNTNITGVSSSAVAPRWAVITAAASVIAILVAVFVIRSGAVAAVLFGAAAWVLMALLVTRWLVLTAKTRRYLVARHDLGDWARLAILAGVFMSIPVGAALVLVAILAVAQAL